MNIYLAGPISGLSYDDVVNRLALYRQSLPGYTVLSPMTGKEFLRNELEFRAQGYDHNPVSTNHAIRNRDKWMVQHQADVVFADLTRTTRVSIGTMMELAWADDAGKHIIVVMEKDNIHRHAFVLDVAHIVFETVEEAVSYLNVLAERR